MPHVLLPFLWAGAAAYIAAFAVWPLLKSRGRWNIAGTVLAACAIALSPAWIPKEQIVARAFACLWCLDVLLRVCDYSRQLRRKSAPAAWREYCFFLIPFPFLLVVFGQKRPAAADGATWRSSLLRLASSGAVFSAALLLMLACSRVALLRESFLLDHCVKLALFAVGIEAVAQAMAAVERLAGFETTPIVDRAYLARTPAEFWFRYNQRVRLWLHRNVFLPSGGRHAPLKGVAAAFLVSAAFHEFFFALATSRADGYQFAFFALQAPAVMLSPQLERLAARSLPLQLAARACTALWIGVTSPLFFHGLDRVFPFVYASQPWLP